MTLRFTILGCGSSAGVPRVASGWGACDPANPKNRRRRCSLLVERRAASGGCTSVLVDTSPDLREQLIGAGVSWLDGVLFTHEHADHTHGIDDLRPIVIHARRMIDAYVDEPTSKGLRRKFGYLFERAPGGSYPPILVERRLRPGTLVTIQGQGGGLAVLPVLQDHGDIPSLGFRFDNVAYSSDLRDLPPESVAALQGLDVWIVDALRQRPHPTHFSLGDALAWIERLQPKRAILTNMHNDLDYEALRSRLPPHIEPAYDGMIIDIAAQHLKVSAEQSLITY